MSSSVVCPMADTTATTCAPDRLVATMRPATALIRSGVATYDPPYFCTIRAICHVTPPAPGQSPAPRKIADRRLRRLSSAILWEPAAPCRRACRASRGWLTRFGFLDADHVADAAHAVQLVDFRQRPAQARFLHGVGQENQVDGAGERLGGGCEAFSLHGCTDADSPTPKGAGHRRQHAGVVRWFQRDIETRDHLVDGFDGQRALRRERNAA